MARRTFSPFDRSLIAEIAGILHSPRETLKAVLAEPRWAGALFLAFAVSAVAGVLLLQTGAGQLALLDQWTNTAEAFGRPVDEALYGQFERWSERGSLVALAKAAVKGPLLTMGIALMFHAIFGLWLRSGGQFRQVLGVTAYAGIILAFREAVAAPLQYLRESLASPTTLGMLFPMFDQGSLAARFLWIIDIFVIWWLVVLAIGTSMLYAKPVRRLASTYLAAYIGGAGALAGAMVLLGGTR